MLKTLRVVLAILSVVAMTFLFLDITGWAVGHLDWLARIQLVPALLALNIVALVILAVLTLVAGRVYCSVICPLGVWQDIVARLRKIVAGRTRRRIGLYRYTTARTRLRRGILVAFLVVVLLGLLNIAAVSLASLIEPYSAFGRMVTAFLTPLYDGVNNSLADRAAAEGTYDFVTVHRVWSAMIFAIAAVTFVVVTLMAWGTGRGYCNTVCPVGTILGFVSRHAWLRPVIDADRCNGCHSCERHCKSSCIDSASKAIDYSRCVTCMDCLGACRQGAITFRHPTADESARRPSATSSAKPVKKTSQGVDKRRRAFLATSGLITGALVAKAAETAVGKVTDGGLTPLKDKKTPPRRLAMVPPGAISLAHINQHCVGCQLCIDACPGGLLTPSTNLSTLMQPVMDYAADYCRPECTACSTVCPAGVFHPLDEAAKSSWKIGTAKVDLDQCLSANGTATCGNCQRHCPAGAITMAPVAEGSETMMPVVNEAACIGCGACEFNCPVGTVASMTADCAAIHVEGVDTQRAI